jgi:phosphopantetheinyl transferase
VAVTVVMVELLEKLEVLMWLQQEAVLKVLGTVSAAGLQLISQAAFVPGVELLREPQVVT